MRSYRAFLFRAIRDNDLKINNEYHKAACDIGYTIPMLEMAGSEHYYFLDKITYIYTRHKNIPVLLIHHMEIIIYKEKLLII
jgi:hypothetical protein